MMLRRNRLTVSPRAHQRGHGFRPDGELVAVGDSPQNRDVLSLISRTLLGSTGRIDPNPIQKNSGLPQGPATGWVVG